MWGFPITGRIDDKEAGCTVLSYSGDWLSVYQDIRVNRW
jgi:hypothetical protein